MNEIITNKTETVTSMEVAEMIGKSHDKLLRDIRNYIEQLSLAKIGESDFFIESTYKNERGKEYPCYLVTKKGCEFIAHKLTGIKGTEFTAKYIHRFHELEEERMNSDVILSMTNMIATLESEILGIKNDLSQITNAIINKMDTGFGALKKVELNYLECIADNSENESYRKKSKITHNLIFEIKKYGNFEDELKVFHRIYVLMRDKCGIDAKKFRDNYVYQNPDKANISTYGAIMNSPIIYEVFLSIATEMLKNLTTYGSTEDYLIATNFKEAIEQVSVLARDKYNSNKPITYKNIYKCMEEVFNVDWSVAKNKSKKDVIKENIYLQDLFVKSVNYLQYENVI